MTPVETIWLGTSLVAIAAGLALLYRAWREKSAPVSLITGWGLIILATIFAAFANSDRGIAQIWVIGMVIASVGFTLLAGQGLPPLKFTASDKAISRKELAASRHPVLKVVGSIWTLLLSGPIAGIIALLAAAAIFRVVRPETGNPATAGVSTILIAVLLWAFVSTILLIESRPLRRSIYGLAALGLTAAGAFI